MKKSLLIAALAVFTMASCSKDEVVSVPQNEIRFNVVTENATKAQDVFCSNNMMSEFKVWASYNNGTTWNTYFAEQEVSGSNGNWTTSPVRYWPAFEETNAKLKFYALAGTTKTISLIDGVNTPNPSIADYEVKGCEFGTDGSGNKIISDDHLDDQEDLLYSMTKDYTSRDTKANINFRHAMSLIEFKAKNTSNTLHVVVSKICVGGVNSKGLFTFPVKETDVNYIDHDDTDLGEDNTNNDTEEAQWSGWSQPTIYITYPTGDGVVKNDGTVYNLTATTEESTSYNNSLLLLPQNVSKYDANTGKGAYMGVYCQIYNIAGTSYANTDILVAEGWALVPVDVTWDLGKKYIYTFIFGDTNGGIDGGDDPDPIPGTDPVLFPIDYEVTVDDFDLISNTEVTLKK